MADVISDPAEASTGSPPAPQIKLDELDDKHLSRYRHPNETRALAGIAVGLVAIAVVLWVARPILGSILDFLPTPFLRIIGTWTSPSRLGLILIILLLLTMVLDIVGQSSRSVQLVAQAVEVTPTTFPQFAPIVDDLRTRFELPRTRVYVSRDAPLTGYTIGVRQPFAIVFSSIGVGALTPDEFKFCLGREMGSIKLGHTRMAVLMGNVNMSLPQPFSFLLRFRSILFGSYNHAQALSCDRIGVVATRNVAPALSTLIKQNLGQVRGAKIDIKSLTPQSDELQRGAGGAILKMSLLLSSQPFAVARLTELVAWAGEPVRAKSTAPAAPAPPTPAASAAAAAASAKAAAESAAAAAASAAAAAAAVASAVAGSTAIPAPEATVDPPIADATLPAAEGASAATVAGSSQTSDALSSGAAVVDGPSPSAAPATPSAVTAAPDAPGTAAPSTAVETSPVTEAVAASAPTSESTGPGAQTPPPAPPEGGAVGVTVPRPPQ